MTGMSWGALKPSKLDSSRSETSENICFITHLFTTSPQKLFPVSVTSCHRASRPAGRPDTSWKQVIVMGNLRLQSRTPPLKPDPTKTLRETCALQSIHMPDQRRVNSIMGKKLDHGHHPSNQNLKHQNDPRGHVGSTKGLHA